MTPYRRACPTHLRPATAAERAAHQRRMPGPFADVGCAALLAVSVAAACAFWALVLFSWPVAVGLAGGVAFLVLVGFGRSIRTFIWRQRSRMRSDLAGGEVEVLEVRALRAMDLSGDHSSVDPAVAIDAGRGALLILKGQWLLEPSIFGNSKRAARRFPRTSFTLTRWPHSGEVLSIESHGARLKREAGRAQVRLTTLPPLPSMVIEGTLDDIDAALEGAKGE